MKIGFICPNLPGHINPMTTLARYLQDRGHNVIFLYSLGANGLPCIQGEKLDDMNASRPEMSKLEGNNALAFYMGVAAKEKGNTHPHRGALSNFATHLQPKGTAEQSVQPSA